MSSAVGTMPIAPTGAFVVVAMFAIPGRAEGLGATLSAPPAHGDPAAPAVVVVVVPPGGKLAVTLELLPPMIPCTAPLRFTLAKRTSGPVPGAGDSAVRLSPQVV